MKTISLRTLAVLSAVLLLVSSLLVLPKDADAATSGSTGTETIYVQTKAAWYYPGGESITLSNSKVTVKYNSWFSGAKTKKIYPSYKVTVKATDGSHTYSKVMSGSSLKLSLKRNKSYYITVKYDSNLTWLSYCNLSNARMTGTPYWRVKSTYKVSYCG